MVRVKRGVVTNRRHKKVLKLAKGFRHGRKSNFRQAKQAVMKAGQNSYRDRRRKKRDFRRLWIVRISAACRMSGMSYSRFVDGLTKADVIVNRKMISEIAVENPTAFKALVEKAQTALEA
ncbi:MAG: 50S ribosomal protein L20 [Patescibacteria group bacterium]|nr:50S ribosomal protein L20 [Patescibacteria group bacterium]